MIENPDKPLITTNFSLHRHLEGKNPPVRRDEPRRSVRATVPWWKASRPSGGKLTVDFIKENHKKADATGPSPKAAPAAASHLVARAVLFRNSGSCRSAFTLRDEADADQPDKARIVRSHYLEFGLKNAKPVKE